MRKLIRTCLLVGAWVCAPGVAVAEDVGPRYFEIELLIFENRVDSDGGEVWSQASNAGSFGETPGYGPSQAVQWLPESQSHLKAERAALDRSSRYRTLAYYAWRQPVSDRARARPVSLPSRARQDAAWVDGTVKVAVERYLHLSLNLDLHLPGGNTLVVNDGVAGTPDQTATIPLVEQRRMRSRELHYFDNPRFGVIALITPYEGAVSP